MEIAACRWGEKIFMSNQKYSETLFIYKQSLPKYTTNHKDDI